MNQRLSLLHNRHLGERCVLIANGPSLKDMDLSFLRRETTIGLNKIFLGFKTFHFYPKYYVAVNPKVIEQSRHEIAAMNCVKFISKNCSHLVKEDGLTYLITTSGQPLPFSKDICQVLHEGWTVTYVALQIVYYLGFSEVVIIGLDHRYKYTGNSNEPHRLDGPDPNHFCDTYFGYGQDWDNPDLQHSEDSFRKARAAFEADGRHILDATLDGACTVFEKADYRQLFGTAR
jgi:hypothetical protein